MNILMYGWEFPPHISGGLGVACYAIVNELAKKHTNITLILPQMVENPLKDNEYVSIIGCNFFKDFDLASLKALCLKFNIKDIGALLHPYISHGNYCTDKIQPHPQIDIEKLFPIKLSGQYGLNLLSEVFHYALIAGKLAATVPHDAIHCHDWLTILAGVEAKRHSQKPLIFHVHALEFDRSGENVNQQVYDIEKYGMEKADRIITVSQYTKNIIVQRYGIPAEKITVVHNGMYHHPQTLPNKNHNQKMVLFLGRITHQKGPYFFVEIAKKILLQRQDIQFVVVGNGNLTSDMIKHVAASRIGQYVHFTGFLDPDTAQKVYQLADVYVMPSVSEPFGLTCLEALSHNVPVVISKQSGVSETLAHALKADFWDVDDMASKILALLNYPALRRTMLKNAVQELKHITWDKAADKIIQVYQQLIG